MITEILNLGIKGDQLVATALERIQKQKEQFKKPEKLSFLPPEKTKLGLDKKPEIKPVIPQGKQENKSQIISSTIQKLQQQKEKFKKPEKFTISMPSLFPGFEKKPEKPIERGKEKKSEPQEPPFQPEPEKKQRKEYSWDTAQKDIKTGITSIGGMDTKNLITGIGHSLDVWTAGVSGILAEMGGAAITFKDKIKQYAQVVGDTKALENTMSRYQLGTKFLTENRSDVSYSERGGIAEAIGNSFGKITPEFKKAIEKLYGGKEKEYDVRETTAMATGNFAALGTDTGFFMQKISDSLGNLPPSMKQKLMPQMFEMIPETERAKQTDVDIRKANVTFDTAERSKAKEMISSGNLERAIKIDEIQKAIDIGLAKGIGTLASALEKAGNLINKKITESNKPPEAAPSGITGLIKRASQF